MKPRKLIPLFNRLFALLLLLALVFQPGFPAQAAAVLTIEPLTWNVIGLDSNNTSVGPNHFPVGARVCNTGDATANNVVASFIWVDPNDDDYIYTRPGTLETLTVSTLGAGACTDFYFEVEVTRKMVNGEYAYNKTRAYYIEVDSNETTEISTPQPRELFVEYLVSQSRNGVTDMQFGTVLDDLTSVPQGGNMTLVVGETYYIRLIGNTATNGYDQIESFINFPNTIFQVLSVDTTYTAESSLNMAPPYDHLYGDACVWQNDPNSGNYRSCLSTGKAGGDITVTYQVKILSTPDAPLLNPEPLHSLIYDFSGSSYHYNAGYDVTTRYSYILEPSDVTIAKSFVPDAITPDGTSTMVFRITNPATSSISGVNFIDNLPDGVSVASTPNLSYTGCGTSPLPATLSGGETTLSFSNITLSPSSACVIKVNVTASIQDTYTNTTGYLYIDGDTNTYNTATADLTVSTSSAVCTYGTMALWSIPNGTTANPPDITGGLPTTQAANVSTATAVAAIPSKTSIQTGSGYQAPDTYSWDTYGYKGDGQYVQFTIQTKNYSEVSLSFYMLNQTPNNGPTTMAIQYSTNGSTFTTLTNVSIPNDGAWFRYPSTGGYDFTGLTSTTGNTYFRIVPTGANNDNKNSGVNFDYITFTGCSYFPPPTLSKSFGADPILIDGVSTLTFEVANTATTPYDSVDLTGVTFTDELPEGLVIANPANASTTCTSGTVSATAGGSTITLSGASMAAASTCYVYVDVTGVTAGTHTNTSGYIRSTESGPNMDPTYGRGTDDITVIAPPVISKSFGEEAILIDTETTTLSFTISNPNSGSTTLDGIGFTDLLPEGVIIVDTTVTGSCGGGTIEVTDSDDIDTYFDTVSLSGASLSAGASCTFSVDVRGIKAGTWLNSTTVTFTYGGSNYNGNTTSDDVKVEAPALSLQKRVGLLETGPWLQYLAIDEDVTEVYYQFTVENIGDVALTGIDITDANVDASGCTWPDPLPVANVNDTHIATCVVGPLTKDVSGGLLNTAQAEGVYNSTTYYSNKDTAEYETTGLTLVKSVLPTTFDEKGDSLSYSYLVTNSGTASLEGPVVVTDNKAMVTCPAVTTVGDLDNYLDPGESITCTATYIVTADDVAAGLVENFAYATVDGVESNMDSALASLLADYGDLPSSYEVNNRFYKTLKADNGAIHTVGNVHLGSGITSEADGQPSALANGDTDDGVVVANPGQWVPGGNAVFNIYVTAPEGHSAYLVGWFDWNNDGDFNEEDEQVPFREVPRGASQVSLELPSNPFVSGQDLYVRFRLYESEPAYLSPTGGVANGEVEDYFYDSGTTTPVTLSYFRSWQEGDATTFEWSTETETGNIGFNLYAVGAGGRILLNPELIPATGIDSLTRQDYTFSVAGLEAKTFFIEDWDIYGETKLRGPFHLGREYGNREEPEAIDWAAIRTEDEAKAVVRQGGWKHGTYPPLNLLVNETGLYRVTYEEMKAFGADWKGVPLAQIALTQGGEPVAITVSGRGTFGPGAYIEFYGQALDTLYTDTNVYSLLVDNKLAKRIADDNTPLDKKATPAPYYMATTTVENQRSYSYSLIGDPWFDTYMRVNKTAKSWSFNLESPGYLAVTAPATISVDVWGITDWLAVDPDHHLQIWLNGVLLSDQTFNGLVQVPVRATMAEGLLQAGMNTLKLTLPADTGVDYDLIYLDGYAITYPRAFLAQDGKLTFTAASSRFEIPGFPSAQVVAYRLQGEQLYRLAKVEVTQKNGAYTAALPGSGGEAAYLVASTSALLKPTLQFARPAEDLTSGGAELLIISHPSFIEDLAPLVTARQAQGYTVKVVDVEAIYAQFNYGIFDPRPIQDYIRFAAANLGTRFVLLVGGDTYDYRNYLGRGSISFIPSLYAATDDQYMKYVPVDPLFADLDGDGLPDLPIGRFPVRTQAELESLIAKTLAYQGKSYGQTAVFTADKKDGSLSFKAISEGFASQLPGWSIQKAYMDDLGVSGARSALIQALNQGVALTNFVGHSGYSEWTFYGLFKTNDAATLTNAGKPTVVVQWGCWNTYYVSTSYNTLADRFLLSGDRGAAAVLGATTLTQIRSEKLLGELLMPLLAQKGMTLGEAVQLAKAQLAQTHPELLDVLLGWSLLGDPTLVIVP